MNKSRILSLASILILGLTLGFAACDNGLGFDAAGDSASRAIPSQSWAAGYYNPGNPVLSQGFKVGSRMTWYWGGCTTLLGVINDGATKELILIDGYVSKDASGLVDFTASSAGIARVSRFADFIKSFLAADYKMKGILTSHSHADHVGDIPLLMYYLKQSPKYAPFPVVADYATYINACEPNNLDSFFSAAELAKIPSFASCVTDLVVYRQGGVLPAASVVADCLGSSIGIFERIEKEGQIVPHAKGFSREYGVYGIAARAYTRYNSLSLGSFGATAFLMDHASVPSVSADYRVDSYQVWDSAYPSETRCLALDTTDRDDFVTGSIETDHLFLTWAPEFFQTWDDYLLGYNRTRTAQTVKDHISFSPGYAGTHYILPMHVDDIMALSYTTPDIASAALQVRSALPQWYMKLTGFLKWTKITYYEPVYSYSMPSFMMSKARLATRMPANAEYWQSWDSPHVDYLVPAAAAWNASPPYYSTVNQPSVKVAFAIFGWRLGD